MGGGLIVGKAYMACTAPPEARPGPRTPKPWTPPHKGLYSGAVGGQAARQARAGSRELAEPVERFAKSLLQLDAPASAVWVTPASIHLFSGQDHSVSTQGDVHLTAAHTVSGQRELGILHRADRVHGGRSRLAELADPIVSAMLAKEIQPRLKALQSQIDGGLKRASDEIREFLDDLLGEPAAAMTVGERAVVASAVPGSRAKAGHNAAAAQPVGKAPARQTSKY